MLEILNNKPFVLNIASGSAVGKTSLAIALLGKVMSQNDTVYYLTTDSEKHILDKISNMDNIIHGMVSNIQNIEQLEKLVDEAIDRKVDYVVLDVIELLYNYSSQTELTLLIRKLASNNINVIAVSQVKHYIIDDKPSLQNLLYSTKIAMLASFVIIITHKKFTKWQRFINKLMFWKTPSNRTAHLVKNRYGNNKIKDFNINFENLKLTNF